MSYSDFQKYLDQNLQSNISFQDDIIPVIKQIIRESVKSVY